MAVSDDSPVPDYTGMLNMNGRGVVVLGAGQGIGRQAAHAAAACGARVACVDLDPDRARSVAAELGGIACSGDVTISSDMDRIAAECSEALGRIDALIDIVGMPRYGPILEMSDEDWSFQLDMCLTQAFLAMRAFGRVMKTSGGGAMAFVSSISARTAPGHAAYGAAKAGLDSLILSAANELGPLGIRVNAVAPGLTATPRLSAALDDAAKAASARRIPLQRLGQPSDVASALLFLVSDMSAYINGTVIKVDGGSTSLHPVRIGLARTY